MFSFLTVFREIRLHREAKLFRDMIVEHWRSQIDVDWIYTRTITGQRLKAEGRH